MPHRLRNGLGSITKLKGNRSKPYLVRSGATYSIGEHGKQKETRSIIGYATSEEEAYLLQLINSFLEEDCTIGIICRTEYEINTLQARLQRICFGSRCLVLNFHVL